MYLFFTINGTQIKGNMTLGVTEILNLSKRFAGLPNSHREKVMELLQLTILPTDCCCPYSRGM